MLSALSMNPFIVDIQHYRQPDQEESMMDDEERKKHFMNAYYNYLPVLRWSDEMDETCPYDPDEKFPKGWTDPLELYGKCLSELNKHTWYSLDEERRELRQVLEEKGADSIWRNRRMLVAQRIFISNFF